MVFDFKVTTWERVTVSREYEQEISELIQKGELTSAEDVFNYLYEKYGDVNVDLDQIGGITSEQMTVEENGGFSTIEVHENNGHDFIWGNGMENF